MPLSINLPPNPFLKRLEWIEHLPDGTIYHRKTDQFDIEVRKIGAHLSLIYHDPHSQEINSRIDIRQPLNLLANYTRAMMLCLAWNPDPRRVYVVGFGGGRVPALLHHYLPQTVIDAVDIEPEIKYIAEKYFGVAFDDRLKLFIADGRDYLESLDSSLKYDLIQVDVFRGIGHGPYRFATEEFWQSCKSRLAANGMVMANLFESDPLYREKTATFSRAFKTCHQYRFQRVNVLFGTGGPAPFAGELARRAETLDETYQMPFSLAEQASHVVLLDPDLAQGIPYLSDLNQPQGYG